MPNANFNQADNVIIAFIFGVTVIFVSIAVIFVKRMEEETKRQSIYSTAMLPDIRDNAKQSIFRINVGKEFSGTAVYISKGYFISNHHVVTTPQKKGKKQQQQISKKPITAINETSSITYDLQVVAVDAV